MDLLCRLLKISLSGYYAWKNRGISSQRQREQLLLSKLVELHEKYPASGLNTLHHIITNGGISCSRNRLHRLMNRKRAYTYIPTDEGWLYAAIVKDLCSKKVVGCAFSDHIYSNLTSAALELAGMREQPPGGLIFHSDRGVQYASNRYRETLAKYNITQSMSRKGDPYDNAVAENFFSCLKCELVHLKHYGTRDEAQADIFAYIETFYNTVRPHSSIGCAYENLLRDISGRLIFAFIRI